MKNSALISQFSYNKSLLIFSILSHPCCYVLLCLLLYDLNLFFHFSRTHVKGVFHVGKMRHICPVTQIRIKIEQNKHS